MENTSSESNKGEPPEKRESAPEKSDDDQSPKLAESQKNFWDHLRGLLPFNRAPDTIKELEQEIHELLEEGEDQGLIGSLEEKLIRRIFEFRETRASEIMTPLVEMVCAGENTSVAELIRIINEEGYTRIPIYRKNQDHIIGILHAKDLLRFCTIASGEPLSSQDILNPPYFVSEHKPIVDLLREFQAKKIHMAIVTDEFGGVRGLVTLEDVIEEIIGEIEDEYDQDENELRMVDERTVIVKAGIDVEEVEAHFGVTLPEGPYESVGGLLIHKLGRVPRTGTVVIEDGLEFRVLSADPRRIKSIRVARLNG